MPCVSVAKGWCTAGHSVLVKMLEVDSFRNFFVCLLASERTLLCVGLVWVVNIHLGDAGREMTAAPQAACLTYWELS